MNENQETRSESDFGHDQTITGTGEPEGAQVNGTESELSVILKEMAGIKTTLSKLETGQSKLETGQSKLETKVETGLNVLDTKVTAWFSNL